MRQADIQVKHGSEFRRCLLELDALAIMLLWKHASPHLPQPKTEAQALVMLHHARTQAESIPLKLRAYSHRFLIDNGYPSGLPDELKPKAERLYPKVVGVVGIAMSPGLSDRPLGVAVRDAMVDVVENAYADRRTDPEFIKPRMMAARTKVLRGA